MHRFPDKPVASSPGVLEMLADGDWIAQIKFDGWRTLLEWDGSRPTLTSRHKTPIPASPDLVEFLANFLTGSPPMLLDGEFMGRRDNQAEALRLFDMLAFDGRWQGDMACYARLGLLCGSFPGLILAGTESRLSIVPHTTGGYVDFFEFSKTLPGSEGIVLKQKTSRFIGSVRKSVDNPLWLKVKWREGADGQLRVA